MDTNKEEQLYCVKYQNKEVYRGTSFQCFKYVLNHQPHSLSYAEKAGWRIKPVSEEDK